MVKQAATYLTLESITIFQAEAAKIPFSLYSFTFTVAFKTHNIIFGRTKIATLQHF